MSRRHFATLFWFDLSAVARYVPGVQLSWRLAFQLMPLTKYHILCVTYHISLERSVCESHIQFGATTERL